MNPLHIIANPLLALALIVPLVLATAGVIRCGLHVHARLARYWPNAEAGQ